MKVTLICDGGCLNNQDENNRFAYGSWHIEGYSPFGADVTYSHRSRVFFGNQTNNVAEYLALINGLEELKEIQVEEAARKDLNACPIKSITIWTDSQLVVNQVSRKWRINDPYLEKLVIMVENLFVHFTSMKIPVTIIHRPREVIVEVLGH